MRDIWLLDAPYTPDMRNHLFTFAFVLLTVPAWGAQKDAAVPMQDGTSATVRIATPPDFDPTKSYSVLVGPGEWYWSDRPSHPGWITVSGDPFFKGARLEQAPAVLDWLRKNYRVRGNKFHIACWSANSAGAFEIVQTHPSYFHSATGVAGMPGQVTQKELAGMKNVRIQFIVGERDSYWRSGAERWHKTFQDAGIKSTLEIIPKGEHVMPEIKNEPFFERMNKLVKEIGTFDD